MIEFKHNKKLTVINLVGGPSAGKSTTAYFLTGHMKAMGMSVEYVHEFAKGCVWDKMSDDTGGVFTEQDYITINQHRLIRRLVAHDIEYAVLDTSLLLGLVYVPEWYPSTYKAFILELYHSYNNIVVYLDRGDISYEEAGRNQTEDEALEKDRGVLQVLEDNNIPFHYIRQNKVPGASALTILDIVLQEQEKNNQIVI